MEENKNLETNENKAEEVKAIEAKEVNSNDNKRINGASIKSFFITTLNGMAYGLFATLIIGTILQTIGRFFPKPLDLANPQTFLEALYVLIGGGSTVLQFLTGAGIGVGVALALKKKPLETVVLGGVGAMTAYFSLSTTFVTKGVVNYGKFQVGDPLTIYLTVIAVALLMKLVLRKKTPVDILIVPLFAVVTGFIIGLLLRYPAIYITFAIQWLVNEGTNWAPFAMGIVVAVLMGMALTAPISSAAIGAMVFTLPENVSYSSLLSDPATSGLALASGAAVVGCCCQMVGFAIHSRKDNSIGMVISIGIGTSMLQFKNILKKPIIWLPTIIASAILGPISTCGLKLVCGTSYAGMGTSGLVGQIGTVTYMGANMWQTWVGIFALEIIAPAIIVYGLDILFRKFNWIKDGDFTV